jgi:hypothetical protein
MNKIFLLVLLLVGTSNGLWTSGNHTFGSGGNATTLKFALDSVGTLVAPCTLSQVSSITENTLQSKTCTLAGYRLVIRNVASPHNGIITHGYKTTVTVTNIWLNLVVTDSGTVEICGLNISFTNTSNQCRIQCGAASSTKVYAVFHDNILNGRNVSNNTGDYGFLLYGTGKAKAYNNIVANFNTSFGCGMFFNGLNDTVENNTVLNCRIGIGSNISGANNSVFNNNLCSGNGYADFYLPGTNPAKYLNNASSDASAAGHGGSNGKTSIVIANELATTDTSLSTFAKSITSGVCYNGGTTPALSVNTKGARPAIARPTPPTNYITIGADEQSPGGGSISVTDMTAHKVWQRAANDSASVLISGTYVDYDSTLSSTEFAIVDSGNLSVLQGWASLASASAGTFSGTVKVKKAASGPKWFNVWVRGKTASGAVVDTSKGTNPWGVGDNWLIVGQSNAQGHDVSHGYTTAKMCVSRYDSATGWIHEADPTYTHGSTGGASIIPTFGNMMSDSLGVPIGIIQCALGSTGLLGGTKSCWGFRDPSYPTDSSALYGYSVNQTKKAIGNVAPAGIWCYQGETDASVMASYQNYIDTFKVWVDRYNTDFGGTVPFYYVQIGRGVYAGADSGMSYIRRAHDTISGYSSALLCATGIDLATIDGVNLSRQSQDTLAVRTADFVLHHASKPIPKISAAAFGINQKNVKLTVKNSFTSLTPVTGITGLEGQYGATWITPDSTRLADSTINSYFANNVTKIRYLWGDTPSVVTPVYRSGNPQVPILPLYPTNLVGATQFTITVSQPANGSIAPTTETVDSNTSITYTATANSGYHFVSWTGGGPTGLTNPQTLPAIANISVGATIAINLPAISYQRSTIRDTASIAMVRDSCVSSGGAVDSFLVSPALPTGLSISKTTGAIYGTPAAKSASTVYTTTAYNVSGTATAQFTLRVLKGSLELDAITPARASPAGGSSVTFTGWYFGASRGAGSIRFLDSAAASYTIWTDTSVTAITKAHPANVGYGVVTNNGAQKDSLAFKFGSSSRSGAFALPAWLGSFGF